MVAAFGWGVLAASSLVIGAVLAMLVRIPLRVVGWILAFGAGVLISAVAFDLVEEASDADAGNVSVVLGMLAGCAVFFAGDRWISRTGGERRKSARGDQSEGSALAIILGTVLDGIPESIVIGLGLLEGGSVGVAYLVAVFASNLPESISSTAGLLASGWRRQRVLLLWVLVVLASGLASALGYAAFGGASPAVTGFVLTFAAGAILTMLADTMMPEAFEHGGELAGVMTTLGFVLAFGLHQLT